METHAKQEVIEAIAVWAERHSRSDEPTIVLFGVGEYTPRELAREVKIGSPAGTTFLRIVEYGLSRFTLDEIVDGFRKDPEGARPASRST